MKNKTPLIQKYNQDFFEVKLDACNNIDNYIDNYIVRRNNIYLVHKDYYNKLDCKKQIKYISIIKKIKKTQKRTKPILFNKLPFSMGLSNFRKLEYINKEFHKKGILIDVEILVKLSHYNINDMIENYRIIRSIRNTQSLKGRQIYFGEMGYNYWLNEKSTRMKGPNNIAYQHNGKYSALSKNFIKYKDISIEEQESRIQMVKDNISTSLKESTNRDNTLIYWINKGYTKEEAKQKIQERQTTFSLQICIEKYGIEKGNDIFTNRQIKWQETLNNKPKEEIKRINFLKAHGLGGIYHKLKDTPNLKGILYYIRFYNENTEFWKIGITTKSIKERFSNITSLNRDIIFTKEDTIINCFKQEQYILSKYGDNRINVEYNEFNSSECFNKDIKPILGGKYGIN